MRGTDTAYDPVNGVFLVVVGNGPVYGVFVSASGQPVTDAFAIFSNDGSNWAHFPRAEYSAHANNGAGGQGAFLVTWNHNVGTPNYVFGRLVSYNAPGRVVSGIQQFSDGEQGGAWHETGPAIAYSPTSQRFLVAWRTLQYGIRGRFLDANGTPLGSPTQLENPGGSRDPALAWNPATDEFGLVYTGFGGSGAFTAFRRISPSSGSISGRTSFGFAGGTFATGIDVNSANEYVLAWALHPGTKATRFDQSGNQLTSSDGTLVTSRFGYDQSLGLAFNGSTGTLLAVGSDGQSWEVAAAEMFSSGAPKTAAAIVTEGATPNSGGSFYPLTAARTGADHWSVVYSRDFRGATTQILAASDGGGGGGGGSEPPPPPPPPPGECTTPDPFGAIGGGTCCNGGWLPPGLSCSTPSPNPPIDPTPPPPPPPDPPGNCSTPDPFGSLGGGTCCNGGWLPPGLTCSTQSTPTPPPPPGECVGSDPFASIPGLRGVCINGGWVPVIIG